MSRYSRASSSCRQFAFKGKLPSHLQWLFKGFGRTGHFFPTLSFKNTSFRKVNCQIAVNISNSSDILLGFCCLRHDLRQIQDFSHSICCCWLRLHCVMAVPSVCECVSMSEDWTDTSRFQKPSKEREHFGIFPVFIISN